MGSGRVQPEWVALTAFIEAYETAQASDGGAELAEFIPAPSHPLYLPVLRELVRIDLEYSWERGRPRRLEEYRRRFPSLFEDRASLQEITFEEYRLRLQAGHNPSPLEYEQCFGVVTAGWPARLAPGSSLVRAAAAAARGEGSDDASSQRTQWRVVEPSSNGNGSSHNRVAGSSPSSARLGEVPRSDPLAAYRLAQTVTAMPEVGTEFLGFHLVAELGQGAFGRVFLARQGDLGNRAIVLKISADLDGESQTLAQLQHTNIVPIYSVHRAVPFQAVCMPYFGATTLADVRNALRGQKSLPESGRDLVSALRSRRLATLPTVHDGQQSATAVTPSRANGTPPAADPVADAARPRQGIGSTVILDMLQGRSYVEAVLWVASRLADGLAHAHERGILHRDLKPANILLTDEGQPMLLDFSLAEDTKLRHRATAAFIGGTLPYMAPEHLDAFQGGTRVVDARSDLYSLGVILFELLTGRHPFEAKRGPVDSVLPRMIEERLKPPPALRPWNQAVSPAGESIIRRCLEPDPAHRYQSARELQEDLQRQLDHRPLRHAREPSLRERARKWTRRHPRLTSSTAVAAVAASILVATLALVGLQRERLARLEARATAERFHTEALPVRDLLSQHVAEPEQMEEAASQGRRLLQTYAVLEDPAWDRQPGLLLLPEEERARVRGEVGEVAFLLAHVTALQAARTDADERLQQALQLNELAGACAGADPLPRAVLLQRAELCERLGESAEAKGLLGRAEATPLRSARDHYLAGTTFVARGRYREALGLLRQAVREDPQHFWAWFARGRCHDLLGQHTDAVACYSTCLALSPRYAGLYHNRGLAYARLGDHLQAAADFDEAVRLRPEWPEPYYERATTRAAQKRYPEAIADYTRALELGSAHTRIYFSRARVRELAGDAAGAAEDRAEGLRRQPTDETSWLSRAVARISSDPEAALRDVEAALQLNPRSRRGLSLQAHILGERLGRTEAALDVLSRALELYPDYAPFRGGRAILFARLGKRPEAHRDAVQCLLGDPTPVLLYQLAGVYALTSRQHGPDRDEAFRWLSAALRRGYGLDRADRDRDLDPIRELPDYGRLLQAARALQARSEARSRVTP